MVLIKAGPAEILRSSQKDEWAIRKLQKLCEDVFLGVLGPRLLIKYKATIQSIGQLLYYGNSTLCGLQTLGEEYTGILQVDGTFQTIPSALTRFVMILLHCFGSDLSNLFINQFEKSVKENEDLKSEFKKQILHSTSWIKTFLPFVSLLHKAIFYCNWGTYHISKRITGVNYVLIRHWLQDTKSLFGFRMLGVISLINFFLHSWQSISDHNKGSESEPNKEIGTCTTHGTVSVKNCTLCLNKLTNPTATMCGHVYCWTCITEWVKNQEKCPICREIVSPSRLIPLHNYI